ncbi:MAG: AraC family transcriptional regulator [Christensenellales bacterium]|jgi:AraC-like DNA-binding protein
MNSLSILNKNFSDLNPLLCGWEQCAPSHSYGPAMREYYLFHFIASGKGSFSRNGIEIPLSRGQMFLIRPGEVTFYKADGENPWSYVWIGFDGLRCQGLLETSPFKDDCAAADVPYLSNIFSQLKNNGNMSPGVELYVLGKLYEIFALMEDSGSFGARSYVQRAEDFMRANYSMPISIGDIAAMIGIDRRYLCRIFSAQKGLSPKDFLTSLRLEKAAELLLRGVSVASAARSVGYDDAFNFSKIFKKKYGAAPSLHRVTTQGATLHPQRENSGALPQTPQAFREA